MYQYVVPILLVYSVGFYQSQGVAVLRITGVVNGEVYKQYSIEQTNIFKGGRLCHRNMHSAVLDATGYTMLLSSFIAFVILLWKGCKRKKKSPFYILSASDIFSAALTAVILLVNHIKAGMRLSYNWQNNTSGDTPNYAWTIEDNYRFPFLQTHKLREVFNEIDRNVTLTCDMKDILMQYGMLFAALTNAFISLLTFTVQCNLNAACMKKRCANVVKSLRNTQLESKGIKVERRESEEEPASLQRDSINVKTRNNIIQRIMEFSKFRTLKEDDDKKPTNSRQKTNFLVMSHWLVPFLVVGILYFAEYSDMNNVKHTEDIECVFESNFPMNGYNTFLDADNNLNIIDSVAYMTPLEYNYFFNEKLSNESKSNGVEIDEIVSKVQSIVRTVLNYRRNSTKDIEATNFSNTAPKNFTGYILANNILKYVKNITKNINSVGQGLNGTFIERDINLHNLSTNNNVYLNQDSRMEIPSFYNLLKNMSKDLDATTSGNLSSVSRMSVENEDDSYREDAQIHFTSTEQSTTQMTTNTTLVQNVTFVSNDQIYGEIMKRIQAASVHSTAKNHYNRSVSRPRDGDQFNISNLKNYIVKRKSHSIKNPFSGKNDNRYFNTETKQSSWLRITNECLISTKFLKLQLFVLSFAIYFLPILLSCILQMRGKHMCENTLATLKTKTDLPSTDSKRIHQNSIERSSTSQGSRDDRSETDIGYATKKDRESFKENESIALEIDCMVRIFNTIKLSLILCVILWTPVFLGTLLRVYSCNRVPQWLTDATFLSAFSFGIVRNALNINIIRIQEACSDASAKENRIHPVE